MHTVPGRIRRYRAIGLTLLAGIALALVGAAPAQAGSGGGDHSPLPWALTLTVSRPTVGVTDATVLVAQSNYNLTDYPGLWLEVFDVDSGHRVGACDSGTSCYLTVSDPVGYTTTRRFVAYVGPLTSTPPATGVQPSEPVWVTWSDSGYTVSLTHAGTTVYAWTNRSVTGFGTIEIRDALTGRLLTSCASGFVCTTAGTYGAFVAFVVPWGIAASSLPLYL